MALQTVTRAALGQVAHLGALYDIRTDSFLGDTLFKSKLEEDVVDTVELGETKTELLMSDTIQEKCSKLDVEAQLRLSFLSGMAKLNGSASYLKEDRKGARMQHLSLMYSVKTVNEEIIIRHNKDEIDTDVLSSLSEDAEGATHVVTGIDWGARCFITCEYENVNNIDTKEMEGEMTAEINKIKRCIDVADPTNLVYGRGERELDKQFRFSCKTDVSPVDKDLPVSFEEILKLAKSMPNTVRETNKGKGVPLTYYLMPLTGIAKICKLQTKLETMHKEIDEGIINDCTDVLERIAKKRQTVYDIHRDLHANEEYVSNASIKRVDDVYRVVCKEESQFRDDLREKVKGVRSGKDDLSTLETFLRKCGPESKSEYEEETKKLQEDLDKISRMKLWTRKGIRYLGKNESLDVAINSQRVVFVLTKAKGTNSTVHQQYFLELHESHAKDTDHAFFVIDTEIAPHDHAFFVRDTEMAPNVGCLQRSTIMKFKDGVPKSDDVYADANTNLIQIKARPDRTTTPRKGTYVKLRCPKSIGGECDSNGVYWKCSTCRSLVEMNLDDKKFYCLCGQSNPYESKYCCSSKKHQIFATYPYDELHLQLEEHRMMDEINILILGETGVGKSTWINSFQYYLYFADLESAMNSAMTHVLIPSSFTFTEKSGEGILIEAGEPNPNERLQAGQSATKSARAYVFHVNNVTIRLIDTPGMGDTGGIEEDKKNFDNILSYLTYYDKINAVCILLKPNNARLTTMFRFCIEELLVQLHSSAKDNILFCFTNARATFYRPGDTLPSLKTLLRDREVGIEATPDRCFCFDNESFRFLACVHSGVQFDKADIATYSASWDTCVRETQRLFHHIQDLSPHRVRDTVCMNEAQRIIFAMNKPLANVTKTIEHNTQKAQVERHTIEEVESDMSNMEDQIKFKGYSIDTNPLSHPRTVCANPECVRYVEVGEDRVQNTVYEQICHKWCRQKGITTETTNNKALRECYGIRHRCTRRHLVEDYNPKSWFMYVMGKLSNIVNPVLGIACRCENADNCQQCGHHYNDHMHVTYEQSLNEVEFLSPEVQNNIKEKGTFKEKKEALLKAIDQRVEELHEEKKVIISASAKFALFIKTNALIPYNDAMGDYLDISIRQEEAKPKESRSEMTMKSLQDIKSQYEEEKKILDEAGTNSNGENLHTPEEVMTIQKQLFQLKHFGESLRKSFDVISITHSAKNMAFGETIAPIQQTKSNQLCLSPASSFN